MKTPRNEAEAIKLANAYLWQEMRARWTPIYNTRRAGLYVCLLPNGFATHLKITCYMDDRDDYVMRLTDAYDVTHNCKIKKFESFDRYSDEVCKLMKWEKPIYSWGSYKNKTIPFIRHTEFSFYFNEMLEVLPWALNNYIEVKEIDKKLIKTYETVDNASLIGKPLEYVWTQKGYEIAQKIRQKRQEVRERYQKMRMDRQAQKQG
jgi:hypothetical protein